MNKYLALTILVILVISTITYTGNIAEKIEKYPVNVNAQNITITAEENIYVDDCGIDPFGDGIKYLLMPYLLFGGENIKSIHVNYSVSNPYIDYYNSTITYTYIPIGWYTTIEATYTIYFRPKQANRERVKIISKITRDDGSTLYPEIFYIDGSWDPNYVYKWQIRISTWTATFNYGQAFGIYFIHDSFEDISRIKNTELVFAFDNNLQYLRVNPEITFTVKKISDTRIETIMLIKFTDPKDTGKTIFRLFVTGILGVQFDKYFKIQSTQDTIEVRVYFNIVQK